MGVGRRKAQVIPGVSDQRTSSQLDRNLMRGLKVGKLANGNAETKNLNFFGFQFFKSNHCKFLMNLEEPLVHGKIDASKEHACAEMPSETGK